MSSISLSRHIDKKVLLRIGVITGIFIISLTWKPHGVNLCLFHWLTGLQCPGCGMTRAFYAISHGQWLEALKLNIFSLALYTFFMGILLRDILYILTGRFLNVPRPLKLEGATGYIVLLLVLAYGIIRNIPLFK